MPSTLTPEGFTLSKTETYADGLGNWHAIVHAELAYVPTLNLSYSQRLAILSEHARVLARAAIIDEVTLRERKVGESQRAARARIARYFKSGPNAPVLESLHYTGPERFADVSSIGVRITLGEPRR